MVDEQRAMDGVYLHLSMAFDIVFYDIVMEKVEKRSVRCIQNCLNGQARVLRDVISGTKAIRKKLLLCTPGFSTGASAIEHLL